MIIYDDDDDDEEIKIMMNDEIEEIYAHGPLMSCTRA